MHTTTMPFMLAPGARSRSLLTVLAAMLCIVTMLALAVPAQANVDVAPREAFASPHAHAVLERRQDSDEAYNTTTSTLPTSATAIAGQPPATSTSTPHDPLLAIMPEFAFSMPAQVVVDGVNLALTSMLTIQLIFTMQYHYPLSKKNYVLQSCSTLILLISLAVHLHTVLRSLEHQAHGWPYMFAYIAVQIPPQDGSWSNVQEGFYLLMRALSTLSVHLTHIQFLTLLFPSALEARLILWMLGPLALAASGMEFTALSPDDDVKTSDLGDAIRNICNSTLFLLYTSGLLIWGLLVNRRRAWRTDGGTAAFGGGSVGLAFLNTTVSFVDIAFDRLWWLPDILWTLTLWQSWLGFWWWVGSGMGIGEVEDRAERQERRRKREARLRRKREREEQARNKAASKANSGSGAGSQIAVAASNLGGTGSDVIRRIRHRFTGASSAAGASSLSRRSRGGNGGGATPAAGESIELTNRPANGAEQDAAEQPLESIAIDDGGGGGNKVEAHHRDEVQTVAGSASHSSDTNPTTSAGAPSSAGWLGGVADYLAAHQPNFIRQRMRRLRNAHVAAARRAATEQSMLRDQVLNRQSEAMGPGLRTMMFDQRNSVGGSVQSPHVGGDAVLRRGSGARVDFQDSLTTGSTDHSSGRHGAMPVLLEGDSLARRTSTLSNSGQNSIHSLSVLPDNVHRSPVMGDDGARRHSLQAGSAASPGLATHSLDSGLARALSRRKTGATARQHVDDDGWVDEEETSPRNGELARETTSSSNEDDSSSNVAHDGDAGQSGGDAAQSTNSWAWRGGLRTLRMRDHTTYD